MTIHKITYSFAIITLFAVGCSDVDSTGFQLRAATNTGATVGGPLLIVDEGTTSFTLESATLNLRDIELDPGPLDLGERIALAGQPLDGRQI